MRTKKMKKALAVLMAATMTMGASVSVFAAGATTGNGAATGAGTNEGHLDQQTISVTLPTDSDSTTFKYIMDPEDLIGKTDGARYESSDYDFADGANVYFATGVTEGVTSYTDTSAKLKVVNKSTDNIGVTLKASVPDSTDSVVMAADDDFEGSSDKELYLALVSCPGVDGDEKKTAVAKDASATEVKLELAGVPTNFEVTWDADANAQAGGYVFSQIDGVGEANWNYFEFCLTGKCNSDAAWAGTETPPVVTVTWAFEVITDSNKAGYTDLTANAVAYSADKNPSVADTAVLEAGSVAVLTVDLGKGNSAASDVTGYVYQGNTNIAWATWDKSASTITLDTDAASYMLSNQDGTTNMFTIVFDNGFELEVTLTAKSGS